MGQQARSALRSTCELPWPRPGLRKRKTHEILVFFVRKPRHFYYWQFQPQRCSPLFIFISEAEKTMQMKRHDAKWISANSRQAICRRCTAVDNRNTLIAFWSSGPLTFDSVPPKCIQTAVYRCYMGFTKSRWSYVARMLHESTPS